MAHSLSFFHLGLVEESMWLSFCQKHHRVGIAISFSMILDNVLSSFFFMNVILGHASI